jgi:hypothetical protein
LEKVIPDDRKDDLPRQLRQDEMLKAVVDTPGSPVVYVLSLSATTPE